jgi:FkbM family methyltransferase
MKITTVIYKCGMAVWNLCPFRRSLAGVLRTVHFPTDKLYKDLWFEGPFAVPYAGKYFQLMSNREDKGTLEIFWKGLEKSWDAQSIKVWGELAKDATVILDIGANMGLYSLAAKTANSASKVYAFEPSRKIVEHLKKNISANKYDISIVPVALSNTIGEADFYDLSTFTAIASLKPDENMADNSDLVTYKVPVTTLKEYATKNQINRIDLVSIDTEMNEPEVLEGMGDLIQTLKPNFLIEVLNNEIGEKVEKYFDGLGYLYFAIDEEHGVTPSKHLSREASEALSKSFNFLVCTPAAAEKLGLTARP